MAGGLIDRVASGLPRWLQAVTVVSTIAPVLAFAPAAYAESRIVVDISPAAGSKVEAGASASFTMTISKDGAPTATAEWLQNSNWVWKPQSAFTGMADLPQAVRFTGEVGDAGNLVSCAPFNASAFRCDVGAGYSGTTTLTFTQDMPRAYLAASPAFSNGHTDGITMSDIASQISRFTVEKGGPSSLSIDVAPGFPTRISQAVDWTKPTMPKLDLITSALVITNKGTGTAYYADLIWDSSISPIPGGNCMPGVVQSSNMSGAKIATPAGITRCELPPIEPGASITVPATFDPNMFRTDVVKTTGVSAFRAEIGGKADAGPDELRGRAADGTWTTTSSDTALLELLIPSEMTTTLGPPAGTQPTTPRPPLLAVFKAPKLGAALHAGIRTPVICARACRMQSQLVISKPAMRKLGLKSPVIGTGAAKSPRAGRVALTTRMTMSAKRKLASATSLRAMLKITTVDEGRTNTISRPVTLRR